MQHIVERIIDGLPVYLKEDYPRFVELLRAYYTWQAGEGKFLDGVYNHEARLDVDRDGLARIIAEMDEEDVPERHRRAFVMFARQFNSSRGSVASFKNFFRIFFDSPVRVTNSAKYVFMPSSAVRERYHRAIVASTAELPSNGVMRQDFGGGVADVVAANCLAIRGASRVYELVVVLRNDKFYPGTVAYSHGEEVKTVEFVPYADFVGVNGSGYKVGDAVTVATDLMNFTGVVKELVKIQVADVTVDAPGTGYKVGEVVTIPGARGFRSEVSRVGPGGGILEVRVIDRGDPFGGVPEFFISSSSGTGAQLSYQGDYGRPRSLSFEQHPFGVVTALEITSESGVDAAFLQTPRLFQEAWVPRGYNGVIGVGSTLTDSAAYQDASYIVSTPVDVHKWSAKVKKLLHPVGRYMHAVKTAGGSASLPGIAGVDTNLAPYEYLGAQMYSGADGDLGDLNVPPPPIDISLLLWNGGSVESPELYKPPAEFELPLDTGEDSGADIS